MNPYIELPDEIKQELLALLATAFERRSEIVFSYAYGSFVELDRFRDLDIAVYLHEDRVNQTDVLDYEMSLTSGLKELISKHPDKLEARPLIGRLPIDVRVLNGAPLGFLYQVTRGRVLTSRDEEFRCTFVERVWTEYFDYAPKAREFFTEMFPLAER